MEKLNQWLSLSANLGVLLGIIFLAVELQQSNNNMELSNRIAIGTAEMQIATMAQNVNIAIAESQSGELLVKLRRIDSELSPAEAAEAFMWFTARRNYWNAAERAFENGLITESVFQIYLADIGGVINSHPNLVNLGLLFPRNPTEQRVQNNANSNSKVTQAVNAAIQNVQQ